MNALLKEANALIAKMTRSEKARLLKWVVTDLGDSFPGVDHRSDVCGGDACIVRTRIPVWTLVRARQLGLSESKILDAYPSLTAEDLAEAWAYARSHADEIDQQITLNENA
jgi:uncharacterized protein (DUF433 family)